MKMRNGLITHLRCLLFAVICLAFSGTVPAQSESGRKLISKADKAFFRDESEKALSLYQQALAQNPDNLHVNYRLGLLYLESAQPEKAIPVLEKAVQLAPKYKPEYVLNLAKAYHLNGNFEAAIPHYQTAISQTKRKDEETLNSLQKRVLECTSGQQLKALPRQAEINTIPKPLNSDAADHVPLLFNNDQSLVFTSRRASANKKVAEENIYVAQFDGTQWSEPQALPAPVNTSGHDAASGISPDGSTLYIYRSKNGGDIYQMKKNGSEWSKAEPLPEPVNSEFYEPSVYITPDGAYAFFASDRWDGYGGLDLYVTLRQPDGSWSEALNLGPNINTEFDEDAPFITPDGLTLYFSSRGHNSMGGFDIFSSNAEGITWTKARNLGFPVNSPYDDIYLVTTASGNKGFFSSDRPGGVGEKDIYGVTFRSEIATDSLIAVAEPEQEPEPEPVVIAADQKAGLLHGQVTEAGTGKPLAAQLVLTELDETHRAQYAKTDSASGKYRFTIAKGKKYSLMARREGYFYGTQAVSMPATGLGDSIEKNFKLQEIKTGAKLVLNNILFEYNSDKLTTGSRTELDRLHGLLVENPGLRVEISGHTDNRGSATYNQALSLKRAQSVVNYLLDKGVAVERMQAVGYGANKPIATNNTENGRQQNRRTEFKVLQE